MVFSFSRKALFLVFLIISIPVFAATTTREATFYSDSFDGGTTSNGRPFDQRNFSAALCGEQLGQYFYVSTGSLGVIVEANDRPNCTKYPNIIDLSREAFRILAPLSLGRLSGVSTTPVGWAAETPKGFLSRETFSHLGVTLESDIPTVLFSGETVEIRGRVQDEKKYAIAYLSDSEGAKSPMSFLMRVSPKGEFSGVLTFPASRGKYNLIIASGNSFNTAIFPTIELIDRSSLDYPTLPLAKLSFAPSFISGGTPYISFGKNLSLEVSIEQDGHMVTTYGSVLSLPSSSLKPGKATVTLGGYTLSTSSPLDRASSLIPLKKEIILDRTHDDIGRDRLRFQKKGTNANFRFTVPTSPRIRTNFYVTFPDGSVREYSFAKEKISGDFLIPGAVVSASFPFREDGPYRLEIVKDDGIAYVNTTYTRGNVWSIIPILSSEMISQVRKDQNLVINSLLKKINILRASSREDLVILDDTLSRLAQEKVQDMIDRSYQAHRDPDGNYIDGFARKRGYTITSALGENIAYGTISDIALEDGLEESGSHRYNMLRSEWKKVGIGYATYDGKVYIVQIFSD